MANEIDKVRFERLKHNVNVQGIKIVDFRNGNGEDIGKLYPNKFDKVLLDTPCSGEGRFILSNNKTYSNWNTKMVLELSKIQKKLFKSAYDSLKPGGTMVYSTCTLNLEEDEKILNWAIENLNVKIIEIDLNLKNSVQGNATSMNNNVKNAIKILPSNNMEGFFIAKIQK